MKTLEVNRVEGYALNTEQAAEFTGLSKKTLANWRSQGRGPRYVKLSPSLVVYRLSDLREFIDEHLVGGEF